MVINIDDCDTRQLYSPDSLAAATLERQVLVADMLGFAAPLALAVEVVVFQCKREERSVAEWIGHRRRTSVEVVTPCLIASRSSPVVRHWRQIVNCLAGSEEELN